MKIIAACLFFLLSGTYVHAQIFGFKKDWSPATDISKASFVMYLTKEDDTTYLCKYYNKYGVAINYETYKDSSLNIPNGLFTWYNSKGFIDSTGYVVNKVKDRFWYYNFNSDFKPQRIEEYDHGRLVHKNDSFDEKIISNTNPDTKQNTTDPEFPGGLPKWKQFLQDNLMPPQPMWGSKANLNTGDVVIDMVIDSLGRISTVFPLQSLDIQSDLEAMRVLKLSPAWTPGKKNNVPILYNLSQRIHFGQ